MTIPRDLELRTPRLLLRATSLSDAERFAQIQSDWRVVRMLRMATHPATPKSMAAWLATHAGEWRSGAAYRFALVHGGRTIGCADIDRIRDGRGELGYWLEEPAWGRGLASEAAGVLVGWAFETLHLDGLDSGCADDNPASAAVLTRLGFRQVRESRLWSKPRGDHIRQLHFSLEASAGFKS